MTVLYPIASDAEAALASPKGRAARESDARRIAGGPVIFVREFAGPVFASEAQALDAYAGRLDDPRPDARASVAPEDRWCALAPLRVGARFSLRGRRTGWRLSVAYWRLGEALPAAPGPDMVQARRARRAPLAEPVGVEDLNALARQPLQPLTPQRALDIGLFEVRRAEAPDSLIPDE